MNTIDNTKIVSIPACENCTPFRSILLLSEIALLNAIPSQWCQSQSLVSSQDNLVRTKRRQIHRSPHPLR